MAFLPVITLLSWGTALAWGCAYLAFQLAYPAGFLAGPVAAILFLSNVAAVSAVGGMLLRDLLTRRDQAVAVLEDLVRRLLCDQARTERLLLNLLPATIAERLRRGPGTIAEAFPEATVLFADIVDFTRLSADTSATEIVELLNEVFSAFDQLADRYGLEKIKTIGDAYMVAGGLPLPRDGHVQAVAEMALDMLDVVRLHQGRNGMELNIRLGIHVGPVVAGVIGRKKLIYDLWGDVVNTASRMESQGVEGVIQVSEQTYLRLRDGYDFQERGAIYVKGKGKMKTFLLLGRKRAECAIR